jgi:hypothetical protein
MASCGKCGAALDAAARFCGACGTRVVASSMPPPPRNTVPAADPFAKTVYGGDNAQGASPPPAAVSGARPAVPRTPAPASPPVAPPGISRGASVLVHWADGNRYPATVLHINGTNVLVAFPSGQQQWVDARYLSAGG